MADDEERTEGAAETDETPAESEIQEETDATPEEAHRIGEFDDIRDMLDDIKAGIASLKESIAVMVEAGATVHEDTPEEDTNIPAPDVPVIEELPEIDLDLSELEDEQ